MEYHLQSAERSRDEILRELNALQARNGLPLTSAPVAPKRPRWSLKRRLGKIRDVFRRRRR